MDKWIRKNKVLIILVLFFMCAVVPFLINIAFNIKAPNKYFIASWSSGDVLTFYGSFLSFTTTVILGGLAYFQNYQLNRINKELQERGYRQKVGVIFPHRYEIEGKKQLKDIEIAEIDGQKTMLMPVQNRGNDMIHNFQTLGAIYNENFLSGSKGDGMLIEIDEYVWSRITMPEELDKPIYTFFVNENTAGLVYYQRIKWILKRTESDDVLEVEGYDGKTIFDKEELPELIKQNGF